MFTFIDSFLNRITMYRLMLYYLSLLILGALILSGFGVLPYGVLSIVISLTILTAVCWGTNKIFARIFKAETNVESAYITAFILCLLITPPESTNYLSNTLFLVCAAVFASASKYLLAIQKKHIFNPAGIAVVLTGLILHNSASWWIGVAPMLPLVLIGGILITRKILRTDLVLSFLAVAIVTTLSFGLMNGTDPLLLIQRSLIDTPLFFFAFVMLVEPLTSPPTKKLRMVYGAIIGVLFATPLSIGSFYFTPEIALVIGNIFSYLVSPKGKYRLMLIEKRQIARDTYEFEFTPDRKPVFKAGQYLEWTLSHTKSDTRGNRRFFTVASSPTEENVRLGIKFYSPSSSFKKALLEKKEGSAIVASQLAGEFILPSDPKEKLVFIAGGIGITPFRSMIKYLLDQNEKRDIVLLYSNREAVDIAYKYIFDEAEARLGIRTIYAISEKETAPPGWKGIIGFITSETITKEVPDYKDRTFYISGPHSMVTAFEKNLSELGIKKNHIKTDLFPGYV